LLNLNTLLLAPLAVLAGASFVIQQAVNANLRAELESAWWAGFASYLGGTIAMLAMIVLLREPILSPNVVAKSTWWS
jgi:transporter family-2 protein